MLSRKPRLNQQLVAQQVAQQYAVPLSPGPGSPIPDDDSDPAYPDPSMRPGMPAQDEFEPPMLPTKALMKKEKNAVPNTGTGTPTGLNTGTGTPTGLNTEKPNKSNTQNKPNKLLKKKIR